MTFVYWTVKKETKADQIKRCKLNADVTDLSLLASQAFFQVQSTCSSIAECYLDDRSISDQPMWRNSRHRTQRIGDGHAHWRLLLLLSCFPSPCKIFCSWFVAAKERSSLKFLHLVDVLQELCNMFLTGNAQIQLSCTNQCEKCLCTVSTFLFNFSVKVAISTFSTLKNGELQYLHTSPNQN